MKCALCQENEADKKNTHYLTDSIIRSCLNYDGGNERETGFYYDISSSKLFIDFNFQHDTSVGVIEEELGRSATDEEIEKAKVVPFAVDYVFCKKCEGIFSAIEDKFASKYLPQFRNSSLATGNQLHFDDTTTFRLFFLMQVWRTHVCTEKFKISASTSEKLRALILAPDETLLKEFPLSITYLTTSGDQIEYTKNFVGFATGHSPNIIFMNDFTIQFYDEINSVRKCLPLYGINLPSTFRYFLNYHEKEFIVKVMSDKERKEILTQAVIDFKVAPLLNMFRQGFIDHWTKKFGIPPVPSLTQSYINGIIDWGNLPQVQSKAQFEWASFPIHTYGFLDWHQSYCKPTDSGDPTAEFINTSETVDMSGNTGTTTLNVGISLTGQYLYMQVYFDDSYNTSSISCSTPQATFGSGNDFDYSASYVTFNSDSSYTTLNASFPVTIDGTNVNFTNSHVYTCFKLKPDPSGTFNYNIGSDDTEEIDIYADNVGIQSLYDNKQIKVYPNPFSDQITITNTSQTAITKVGVIDILGREVITASPNQLGTININTQGLSKGSYLVKVYNNSDAYTVKLIKE